MKTIAELRKDYRIAQTGRLVREGNKTYRYGYLDKVLSVTEGEQKYTYDYHVDGQLARADYGNGKAEDFGWDGLALIKRGDERFVNEPHIGGGNPVASSKGTKYFNDILGTTLGAKHGKYTAAALTAFGERLDDTKGDSPAIRSLGEGWFTGKPEVAGLGRVFLFRNYRAGLAKWQTADPLGYPDGWNQLAYCNNGITSKVDYLGCSVTEWAEYSKLTAQTYENWNNYATTHHSDYPIQGEKYERLFDSHVLVSTRDYGLREINGNLYHVYQDYYYDVYVSELYGALDPVGEFRSILAAVGISAGVGGLVVTFANPLIGLTVTVAGISVGIASAWEPDWTYLGDIYRIHPETLQIKYRKELIE